MTTPRVELFDLDAPHRTAVTALRAAPEPTAGTPLRVVLFDLDDTLFAHRAAVDGAILDTLKSVERTGSGPDDAREVLRWTELEERHYAQYLAGDLDYLGQRRARARGFLEPYGRSLTDVEAEDWFEDYLAGYRDRFVLHDDALPCLDALAARIPGVRFGIITNGDEPFQVAKLDALGIANRMEHLVCSGSFGRTKPDPRIFLHAVELFGADPAEVAYIGDRLRTDAIGSAAAGLIGVWVNRTAAVPLDADRAEAVRLHVRTVPGLVEAADALAPHDHETEGAL